MGHVRSRRDGDNDYVHDEHFDHSNDRVHDDEHDRDPGVEHLDHRDQYGNHIDHDHVNVDSRSVGNHDRDEQHGLDFSDQDDYHRDRHRDGYIYSHKSSVHD